MKTRNKALLVAVSAGFIAAASAFGTVAYLTDQDAEVNTFTVGKVEIVLDEAKVGDDGQAITGENATRVPSNEYELVPGGTYDKDPMVTMLKGSEESYVRLLVTINEQDDLDAICSETGKTILNFFGGVSSKWELYKETENADNTRTYEFRYSKITDAAVNEDLELEPLFTNVVVPGEITKEHLKSIEGLKIDIVAHAVQAAGFADANAAWAAFEEQN